MAISINWLDVEKSTLLIEIIGDWRWEDVYTALQEAKGLADQSSMPLIDAITDVRHSTVVRSGYFASLRQFMQQRTARSGINVIVSDNFLVDTLVHTFRKVHPSLGRHLAFAPTIDDAIVLLAEIRGRQLQIEPVAELVLLV